MFNDDNFDGRDALVKQHFGKESLVAKAPNLDDQVKQYTDPWAPSPYSQFDDVQIGTVGIDSCVEGIHGMTAWYIPVRESVRISGGYDQRTLGVLEIVQVPDYETGEYDILISIMEDSDVGSNL